MSITSKLAVSGIMPLYNQRGTVVEAIESALNQTRLIDELIIVDDGSTDGSGDLVSQRYGEDRRILLIRQHNQGAGAARNAGIRASRFPVLAFLDADDRWLPTRIEEPLAVMQADPACMLVFSASVYCNETLGISRVEGDRIDKKTYVHKEFFREDCLPNSSGMTVRREALDEIGLFDESLRKCQDTDLYLRLMVRFGFEHIPEPLVWVRRGPQRTEPDMSKWFQYHDLYFRKHHDTFGRDIRGQAIWRAGYGAVLRRNGIWCLRNGRSWQGACLLLKACRIWPFFNPHWVLKTIAEYSLGAKTYKRAVSLMRKVIPATK